MSRFSLKALQGLKNVGTLNEIKELPISVRYKLDKKKMYTTEKMFSELKERTFTNVIMERKSYRVEPSEKPKIASEKDEKLKAKFFNDVFGKKIKYNEFLKKKKKMLEEGRSKRGKLFEEMESLSFKLDNMESGKELKNMFEKFNFEDYKLITEIQESISEVDKKRKGIKKGIKLEEKDNKTFGIEDAKKILKNIKEMSKINDLEKLKETTGEESYLDLQEKLKTNMKKGIFDERVFAEMYRKYKQFEEGGAITEEEQGDMDSLSMGYFEAMKKKMGLFNEKEYKEENSENYRELEVLREKYESLDVVFNVLIELGHVNMQ
jgi:hypothetical protein